MAMRSGILGFVYETAIHCESCAVAQFGEGILHSHAGGIVDRDGHLVTPYTMDDADQYSYTRPLSEHWHLYCADCRALLYDSDDDADNPEEDA